MSWLWLSLASSALLGLYEVSRKAALVQHAPLNVLLAANLGGWCGLSLALYFVRDLAVAQRGEFYLIALTASQHGAVLVKALLVTASWVMSYSAVKHLPLTVAGPLRAVAPAFTVLGALVLFQETPTSAQWLGIGILFLGYLGFAQLGTREGISYVRSPHVLLLVLGTVVGAMSGLFDKHLLQYMDLQPTTLQFWFVTYTTLLQVALLGVLHTVRRGARMGRISALLGDGQSMWAAPLAGVFLVLADQFYFRALAHDGAMVSVISLVRRSSVLVSFSLGAWLFREQLVRKKATALVVVLAGLFILLH